MAHWRLKAFPESVKEVHWRERAKILSPIAEYLVSVYIPFGDDWEKDRNEAREISIPAAMER